jgi:hypothetical protein
MVELDLDRLKQPDKLLLLIFEELLNRYDAYRERYENFDFALTRELKSGFDETDYYDWHFIIVRVFQAGDVMIEFEHNHLVLSNIKTRRYENVELADPDFFDRINEILIEFLDAGVKASKRKRKRV